MEIVNEEVTIYIVFQNDNALQAFEDMDEAVKFKNKLREEYKGIPLGNNFHIRNIKLTLRDEK